MVHTYVSIGIHLVKFCLIVGACLYLFVYVFVGKLWSRSLKLAYNLLHKLGTKQEPIIHPGDRVSEWLICIYLLSYIYTYVLSICIHSLATLLCTP